MGQKRVAHVAKIKGLSREVRIKDVKKFFMPIRIKDFKVIKNGTGIVFFRNDRDLSEALKKEGEVSGRAVKVLKHVPKKKQCPDTHDQNPPKPSWPTKTTEEIMSAILETGRLFVRNLSYTCTEQDLEKLFSPFGALSDIHLAFDSWSHTSKGFAFVTFLFPSDAVKAYKSLDKTKFMDRLLHIIPGQEPLESQHTAKKSTDSVQESENPTEPPKMLQSSFKSERFEELKKSSNVGHNWNALFIRPDAVATYLAAKFGLTMEQVLDPTGNKSVAVRLAHGETQLIAEMKEFLQSHGVRLKAFENQNDGDVNGTENHPVVPEASGQRNRLESKSQSAIRQLSGTAFLIKNLPAGTTEHEVRDLLRQYTKSTVDADPNTASLRSGLKRVLVPPLGITAIVEYTHSQQARLMYKALAYEPFRDSVLFVQWLPDGALKPAPEEKLSKEEKSKKISHKKRAAVEKVIKTEQSDAEFELVTSVPTDNYTPKTKEEHEVEDVEMNSPPKGNDKLNGTKASAKSKQHLNKKQKIKQQTMNADNDLVVRQSKKVKMTSDDDYDDDEKKAGEEEDDNGSQSENTTEKSGIHGEGKITAQKSFLRKPNKIVIVRNVPFQATQKELVELFQPIGGLVNVRLPKKATGGHRGFAFIEFDTLDKAKAAIETLGVATHLLGRRLRIEYAQA
ncbi:unnamed protein product [Trichobilharzia szidati]|nr:unnamed protein product [Trichobilharzia szidati]